MKIEYNQFIGIYEESFTKEFCERTIKLFENLSSAGYSVNRQIFGGAPKSNQEDLAVFGTAENTLAYPLTGELQKQFNEILWSECYAAYADEFWTLKEFGPHNSYSFKVQKTEPGQGYHIWHCESSTRAFSNRVLAWTLYLNDVEEGGETEFIFQRMRVKPKTGTLVIWPAGFTHTHRGNPPISNTKYIVTGWIEL
jgi:hypothetical protein